MQNCSLYTYWYARGEAGVFNVNKFIEIRQLTFRFCSKILYLAIFTVNRKSSIWSVHNSACLTQLNVWLTHYTYHCVKLHLLALLIKLLSLAMKNIQIGPFLWSTLNKNLRGSSSFASFRNKIRKLNFSDCVFNNRNCCKLCSK